MLQLVEQVFEMVALSHPARIRLVWIPSPTLSSRLSTLSARRRTRAKFSAASAVRTWLRSSPKATSIVQCNWFSRRQCRRVAASNRSASASATDEIAALYAGLPVGWIASGARLGHKPLRLDYRRRAEPGPPVGVNQAVARRLQRSNSAASLRARGRRTYRSSPLPGRLPQGEQEAA